MEHDFARGFFGLRAFARGGRPLFYLCFRVPQNCGDDGVCRKILRAGFCFALQRKICGGWRGAGMVFS